MHCIPLKPPSLSVRESIGWVPEYTVLEYLCKYLGTSLLINVPS